MLKEIDIKNRKLCEDKHLDYRSNIDIDIPSILYGDSLRIKESITSLVENSIKHTSAGFLEFSVNSIITYDICRLIISIKDSNKDIKKDDIEKGLNSTNELAGYDDGNIELYNIKKILSLIGGNIFYEIYPNYGTEFTIVIDQKVSELRHTKLNKYRDIIGSYKIMIVSDSKDDIEMFKKKLKRYQNITCSFNGEECLK